MKTTIIFVIVAATVVVCKAGNRQFQGKLRNELGYCASHHKINLLDFKQQDVVAKKYVTENIKCFTKCLFERMGFIDSKGNVNETFIIENSFHEKVISSINKCKPSGPIDTCEIAFNVFNCVRKEEVHNYSEYLRL